MGTTKKRRFGNRRRPIRIFTTSTTKSPYEAASTRRTSFVPRKATERTTVSEGDATVVDHIKETTEAISKNFHSRPTGKPSISLSADDRRLLLRKLFSGRSRG